ncbi:DMT family transporter [Photobacterium profundum]|uniref:DMT family transporter n=1 Tax=Photobacterium profundum TaxID=74109 RepID=UPI003D11CA4B
MNTKYTVPLLFLSVCLIWGTTWFAMEVAVSSIPPIFATSLRFLIAAPILVTLTRWYRQPLMFPKGRRHWMVIVAVFYFAIPFTLMIFGEQYISSGLAAIIFANMPIAVMMTSTLFLGLNLGKHQIAGLLVAVVSLSVILKNEMNIGGASYLIGMSALSAAVMIHALMYVFVQKYCKDIPVLTYNTVPCFIASILLVIVSLLLEGAQPSTFSSESLLAVLYLGVFASVGGIVAYFKLNELSTPFTASLCFLLFPIVALMIAAWNTAQPISPLSIGLLLPLFAGILVTKTDKSFWALDLIFKQKMCSACRADAKALDLKVNSNL